MIDAQIQKILKELSSDVNEALQKVSKDVAKEGVDRIKNSAPKKSGQYAAGWGQSKRGDAIVLHNKKKPGLTHLLEKGHAKRSGGRVAPIKHIEPVEEWIKKEMVNRIEQELK